MSLLAARGLTAKFSRQGSVIEAVSGADLDLFAGRTTGVVGASGSGKSTLSLALIGLLPGPGSIAAERVDFDGDSLLGLSDDQWRRYRGSQIGLITQHPRSAFNPVLPVGEQIATHYRTHVPTNKRAARERALEMLSAVGLPDPSRQFQSYPHELSGGMAQRSLIALALSTQPRLLIADEPTTALDATIQAQVLDLMSEMKVALDLAILLVTHSMGVVNRCCDDVYVMNAGRLSYQGPLRSDPSGDLQPTELATP